MFHPRVFQAGRGEKRAREEVLEGFCGPGLLSSHAYCVDNSLECLMWLGLGPGLVLRGKSIVRYQPIPRWAEHLHG